MRLACYTLDAFTDRVFGGNPAAVCPLEEWLDEGLMQNIASENNLAETAFFVPDGDGYHIRWFTPTNEVELCGHATLASAYVIFNYLSPDKHNLRFRAQAGELRVSREGEAGVLSLDFPSRPPEPVEPDPRIVDALGGASPSETWKARDHLYVFKTEAEVRALKPDFARLRAVEMYALTVTAPGDDCDFVSRFFAPGHGIDEDPVTGSAHCTLIPFWAKRLGKNVLHARQVSRRGGELFCELKGDRVKIAGHVALYAKSTLTLG
ncbi:MAG TPA: PhzF family phenazine biosynthesis protein [Bryobacteraceae bacterium]|nr:PhzF family phenazine biosynthesis protein [Bryobacteraceae bacterium]